MMTPVSVASNNELISVLQTYNEVTEKLKRSHEALAREVCRLRDELREKNAQLQRRERLAALGEMAAGVAHEIRNPLGGIEVFASLLKRDLADRPRELEMVRKMSAAVSSLEAIVGDILAFAGHGESNRRRVSAQGLLAAALDQTAVKADATGATLEVAVCRENGANGLGDVELFCDSAQVERAVVNLLSNAIDAAGCGGKVWVRRKDVGRCMDTTCGAATPSRRLASWEAAHDLPPSHVFGMAIEDDGPGIPDELLPRIFDPFFTTKNTGTGLGLAIVHRIAESNGGWVTAGNRPEGGASFLLAIPRASEEGTVKLGDRSSRSEPRPSGRADFPDAEARRGLRPAARL